MGHMLNTIQDVLIRRARLKGFNVLGSWYGSCLYSYRSKVVAKLKAEGINKKMTFAKSFFHAWMDR
jgi:valyl-tRNA synthetase